MAMARQCQGCRVGEAGHADERDDERHVVARRTVRGGDCLDAVRGGGTVPDRGGGAVHGRGGEAAPGLLHSRGGPSGERQGEDEDGEVDVVISPDDTLRLLQRIKAGSSWDP